MANFIIISVSKEMHNDLQLKHNFAVDVILMKS